MNGNGDRANKDVDRLRDFPAYTNGETEPSELFFQLTRRLRSQFNINKGVLLLRSGAGAPLAAISTWHNGQTREGLAIKLPSESSLFEKVAKQGQVYTDNFCGSFTGNFFEKKLLLEDNSRSFVLQPIKHGAEVIGLLGFSSEQPTAFTLFEEGELDQIVSDFAAIIRDKTWSF
jgi:transcriptional regulator with GAF, ATPase, and Fis domain